MNARAIRAVLAAFVFLLWYAPGGAGSQGEKPPELKRRTPPKEDPPPLSTEEPAVTTIRGRLRQLDCVKGTARMHLVAGKERTLLMIRHPSRVKIRNTGSGSVDLVCGPQNRSVSVDYVAAPDPKQRTKGDVYAIEFLK